MPALAPPRSPALRTVSVVFTGLVRAVGEVAAVEPREAGVRLVVRAPGWEERADHGDSIAIDGVCLTVAGGDSWAEGIAFDAVRETLDRSTLGALHVGSRVNLEAAARADSLLGGHVVQGHVDAVGTVVRIDDDPMAWRVAVRVPRDVLALCAPKGSIAVSGVSLTIASVWGTESGDDDCGFEVALIPTTLDETNLRGLAPGDGVNIETDIIARQVVHALRVMGKL